MNLERTSHPSKGEARPAAPGLYDSGDDAHLMERVVERENVILALARVQQNKGSPGIDGMTVGIPTVVDRFVQQAILQVLQPRFDPSFSEHSYGFRPGRNAHDAVRAAHQYIQDGRNWVVDVDLEKFFDRVNHDVLMSRLEARIADKRMLRLIRSFLISTTDGIAKTRGVGLPQGGPISPLLANVLLDEVDKQLEKRGHTFVRYADDCNVYVRSRKAGERVMNSLRRVFGKIHLRINETKSTVARPWERKFLGYSFYVSKDGHVVRRISDQAIASMKAIVRMMTRRTGRSIEAMIAALRRFLPGWKNYFCLTELRGALRELDAWIRRRLRAVQLKHWEHPKRVRRELIARGFSEKDARSLARHTGRWWFQSKFSQMHRAFPASHYDNLGLPRLYVT